jgi:hypothetical protein
VATVIPNQYDDGDAAPARGGTLVCRDVDWWHEADDVHAARFAAPLPQDPRSSTPQFPSMNDIDFAWRAGAPAAVA